MKATDFNNHEIHQKVLELLARCNDENSEHRINAETALWIRCHSDFLTDRLKLAIPTLVNEDEINAILNEMKQSIQLLIEFSNDGNQDRVVAAIEKLKNTFPFIRNIPFQTNKAKFELSSLTANYEIFISDKIRNLENHLVKNNIEIQNQTNLLVERQQQIEEIKSGITASEIQILHLEQNFQIQLDEIKAQNISLLEQIRESQQNKLDATLLEFSETNQAHLSTLAGYRNQAKNLLNVISEDGTATHYKQTADYHRKSANQLRLFSIVLMLIIFLCIMVNFYQFNQSANFDWAKYLLRILTASILIYPASYAAKESTKHRNLETEIRKAELEMAAIGPFIELLDDSKKQAIKEKLTDKYFGQPTVQNASPQNGETEPNYSIDQIEKMVKLIKSVLP